MSISASSKSHFAWRFGCPLASARTNTIYDLTDPISGLAAEKLIGAGGSVTWTNYIGGAGGVCAMRVEYANGALATRYFHKDHLGSIAILTTETGSVDVRLGYDASKRSLASPRRGKGATPTVPMTTRAV